LIFRKFMLYEVESVKRKCSFRSKGSDLKPVFACIGARMGSSSSLVVLADEAVRKRPPFTKDRCHFAFKRTAGQRMAR